MRLLFLYFGWRRLCAFATTTALDELMEKMPGASRASLETSARRVGVGVTRDFVWKHFEELDNTGRPLHVQPLVARRMRAIIVAFLATARAASSV
jgi:hypothetical protein